MAQKFHVYLIKPSRYDKDGYVISWWRGVVPFNSTLACLYGLTADVHQKQILGPDVEISTHVYDETVQHIPVEKIGHDILRQKRRTVVCLAGVQSNQYPRALDLGLEFRKQGIPVMIGGFHVSGILAMFHEPTSELQDALKAGITLVAGEVEEKWGMLLNDAYTGSLKPVYNFLNERPALQTAPIPFLPPKAISRYWAVQPGFDTGRGCPFHCSFCTIINVQGNVMRSRSAEDVEQIVRRMVKEVGRRMLIADDNFSRNPMWEKIADRLIWLREKEKLKFSFAMQVDTAAHKIPHFVEKMARAGVDRVFMGLESVNPANLKQVIKHHNQLSGYHRMLEMWHEQGVLTTAGYIIGFPTDDADSVRRDVEHLKELPLDAAEFGMMTPMPGSADHKKHVESGRWADPDLNLYDIHHACMNHPKMSQEIWKKAYHDAWKSFYSPEHTRTLFRRAPKRMRTKLFSMIVGFRICVFFEEVHPLCGGFLRMKKRRIRRRGMALESVWPYYRKRISEIVRYFLTLVMIFSEVAKIKLACDLVETMEYAKEMMRTLIEKFKRFAFRGVRVPSSMAENLGE